MNHYNETHNDGLATWVRALDGKIKFTYITCQNAEVDDLEKSLIRYLQPTTNVVRYLDYVPKRANWRKANG